MLRRTRDVLAEAADMLDGPEPKEDWSDWRIRSLALAKRLRLEMKREDSKWLPTGAAGSGSENKDPDDSIVG